jgi:hypothetical protein
MKKYFKFPAESDLGIGTQYIEFNNEGWAIRQVECYGNRWFNSNKSGSPVLMGITIACLNNRSKTEII